MNTNCKTILKQSLFNNQLLACVLLFLYCSAYGITAQFVLTGFQLIYFFGSLFFALLALYVRDPGVQKANVRKSILYNQLFGTAIVFSYLLVYGITSVALLNGFQLVFFMSSYAFTMSLFYLRDPERLEKTESNISVSISNPVSLGFSPCLIDKSDMAGLLSEISDPLTSIIGFSELLIKREYTENEKDYMIKNIYEKAVSIYNSLNKVTNFISDSPTNPKDVKQITDNSNNVSVCRTSSMKQLAHKD